VSDDENSDSKNEEMYIKGSEDRSYGHIEQGTEIDKDGEEEDQSDQSEDKENQNDR
jgi:hypothetical protein